MVNGCTARGQVLAPTLEERVVGLATATKNTKVMAKPLVDCVGAARWC